MVDKQQPKDSTDVKQLQNELAAAQKELAVLKQQLHAEPASKTSTKQAKENVNIYIFMFITLFYHIQVKAHPQFYKYLAKSPWAFIQHSTVLYDIPLCIERILLTMDINYYEYHHSFHYKSLLL